MSPNEFCLWLQGYVELGGGYPNEQQWESIKDHLQLVMDKKSPVRNVEVPSLKEHMEKVAEQFKENPEWQRQLLKDRINPKDLQITC